MFDEFVPITTFLSSRAALRAQTALQAAGIGAVLQLGSDPQRPVDQWFASATRLLVLREDAMEAASLLGVLG